MILFIDNSQDRAEAAAEIFHYMGIVTVASTPENATSKINNRYRAVILSCTEGEPMPAELIFDLKRLSLGAPIFALISEEDAEDEMLYRRYFDEVIINRGFSCEVYSLVTKYLKAVGLPAPGEYRLSGLDGSINLDGAYYFGERLPFTKTEIMILRYLIRSYPVPVSSLDILHSAYKPGRAPEISNIRTHISIINKKFREAVGRSLIEKSDSGKGYIIATPEGLNAKKEILV